MGIQLFLGRAILPTFELICGTMGRIPVFGRSLLPIELIQRPAMGFVIV